MERRVLVLRLSALGDVAMTLPVIYSVARAWPAVRFTVVTRPFFRRLFIDAPANVDYIDFDPRLHRGVGGLLGFVRELRAGCDITAVADLHDVLRTRVIRMAMRRHIPVATVDKDRRGRKELTELKGRDFQRNYVDRYFDVFAALGFPAERTFTSLFPEAAGRRGVGLAPFARYATKTYPPDMMEDVARLLTDAGVEVALFGAGGEEAERLRRWTDHNPKLRSVAGQLPLEEEIRLMSTLKLMVSMDSANMHLASLAGTRVVSVWGSTIPQCGFLGYGQSADDALWLDLECQPCSVAGLPECPIGHYACLERIEPERLAAKILAAINS